MNTHTREHYFTLMNTNKLQFFESKFSGVCFIFRSPFSFFLFLIGARSFERKRNPAIPDCQNRCYIVVDDFGTWYSNQRKRLPLDLNRMRTRHVRQSKES